MSVSLIDGHIDPDKKEVTPQEAIEWLKAIEEKYIHGGDEAFDSKRKMAINAAISALEKQMPKGLIEYKKGGYSCRLCKSVIYPKSPYCIHCGQALDWSDTE